VQLLAKSNRNQESEDQMTTEEKLQTAYAALRMARIAIRKSILQLEAQHIDQHGNDDGSFAETRTGRHLYNTYDQIEIAL
jgi:hypothetical protein